MKNIHVLSTIKSSKVYSYKGNSFLTTESYLHSPSMEYQNIYITSDEEIKKDEYYLGEDNNIYCLVTTVNFNGKKIILTDNKDLIKDGVQAIPDEFLEWFVKNPSCDEIYVNKIESFDFGIDKYVYNYKIIIPKEEPKQEKLEEAGLKHCDMLDEFPALVNPLFSFKQGAKWQQENSNINALHFEIDALKREIKVFKYQQEQNKNKFSEEDMRKAFIAGGNSRIEEDDVYGNKFYDYMEKWFEQFKKK